MTITLPPLLQFLLWPLWWYSHGLVWLLGKLSHFLANQAQKLNILVWAKNLFVPMFGEYDNVSRFISFFARFFTIIFKTIGLLFCLIFALIIFAVWLILPPLIIYLFIKQII
jgi:hypothetical protein